MVMASFGVRDHWSDGQLLAAISAGDGTAFERFYGRHLPGVIAFLLRETRDREATADLAAEVFAAVLLASHRFRDDGGSAGPWVIGIARNKLRLSRRRQRIEDAARKRLGFEPVALDDAALERVEQLADEGRAVGLVDSLPENEREAVRLHVLEEVSYEQIAGRLRCSEMVVRKRVSRGLGKLRERFGER